MAAFRQITIIGCGLIGGSFGLAVRKHGFHGSIVGCDREPVLAEARRRGAIGAACADPAEACRGSQLVLLATPVGAIIDLLERLGPMLPPETLLTDVGSTKTEVLARACAVFGNAAGERFLGGHPMAGKEHGGIEHASPDLFQDAAWILTPFPGQNLLAGSCNALVVLLETIGARILTMDAAAQDRLCAWVSHLPQFMATALAATLVEEFGEPRPDAGESPASTDVSLSDVHAVGGRALRNDARRLQPSLDVARHCHHQHHEHRRRPAAPGAAARPPARKPALPRAARGIRPRQPLRQPRQGATGALTSAARSPYPWRLARCSAG